VPFQAKISRARFVLGPFTSEDMLAIGNVLRDSIAARIGKGLNVNDAPAKELKPGRNGRRGYPDYKKARGLQPIRDWFWTGRTMRSLKVKSASENQAVIGFVDPNADRVAHLNNLREKQFGISPKDRKALKDAVLAVLQQARVVRARRAA
jgi:hypothetical protein